MFVNSLTGGATSPSGTVVTAGSGGSIRDASGNVWTINAAGQVTINGQADTTTSNVIELAYVNGIVWQEVPLSHNHFRISKFILCYLAEHRRLVVGKELTLCCMVSPIWTKHLPCDRRSHQQAHSPSHPQAHPCTHPECHLSFWNCCEGWIRRLHS
jgi:hypothetical protein